MVKLKKVLAVTLGAALMVGSLAGCGNNSSKSADGRRQRGYGTD